MTILIDTHSLIWYIEGDRQLSKKAISILENTQNQKFISKVSLWEMAIKISIGKLKISLTFAALEKFLEEHAFIILDYDFNHLSTLLTLPFHHSDPFDRLIISQAITDKLTVLTKDKLFSNYSIDILY